MSISVFFCFFLAGKHGQDIILHETVEREELPFLQASDCVIILSLNEGFGFTSRGRIR